MLSRKSGFSFLELMIVLAIMAILSTTVVIKVWYLPGRARVARAKTDIGQLEMVLEQYHADNGRYPTEEQGLTALVEQPTSPPIPKHYVEGGYVKRVPLDPWDNEYVYSLGGEESKSYEIMSYGRDGEPGGTLEDADISSLEL